MSNLQWAEYSLSLISLGLCVLRMAFKIYNIFSKTYTHSHVGKHCHSTFPLTPKLVIFTTSPLVGKSVDPWSIQCTPDKAFHFSFTTFLAQMGMSVLSLCSSRQHVPLGGDMPCDFSKFYPQHQKKKHLTHHNHSMVSIKS